MFEPYTGDLTRDGHPTAQGSAIAIRGYKSRYQTPPVVSVSFRGSWGSVLIDAPPHLSLRPNGLGGWEIGYRFDPTVQVLSGEGVRLDTVGTRIRRALICSPPEDWGSLARVVVKLYLLEQAASARAKAEALEAHALEL